MFKVPQSSIYGVRTISADDTGLNSFGNNPGYDRLSPFIRFGDGGRSNLIFIQYTFSLVFFIRIGECTDILEQKIVRWAAHFFFYCREIEWAGLC